MAVLAGDAAPTFRVRGLNNPDFALHAVAGRYLLLGLLSRAGTGARREALDAAPAWNDRFDGETAACLIVLPAEESQAHEVSDGPGLRWLFDDQDATAALYGVEDGPRWFLLDPMMQVLGTETAARPERLLDAMRRLPPLDSRASAPVLVMPRIFEPELCARLIDHYRAVGGRPSGFMREIDGVTTLVSDNQHKMRHDVILEDQALIAETRVRIARRLGPQIEKAFQFKATRMERYLVACYDAETGGHFRPHRDNTTRGTAHRRFAVSINLNADFEGGDLRFPEFGRRTYRPAPGGAVVFSCSLLHEATPVRRGQRYAFLPFLYDEAAAAIREANSRYLDPALTRAAPEPEVG